MEEIEVFDSTPVAELFCQLLLKCRLELVDLLVNLELDCLHVDCSFSVMDNDPIIVEIVPGAERFKTSDDKGQFVVLASLGGTYFLPIAS